MVIAGITSWLEALVTNLVCWIQTGLVRALNFVIASLGALLAAVAGLMPDMPAMPERPSQFDTALGWMNWVFPVGTVVQVLTFLVGAWLIWQGVVIALRWAKASAT